MVRTYLLSKTLDPILGVFTGVVAFRLSETNPRTAPLEGETLGDLLRWRYGKWKASRARVEEQADAQDGWEEITKALEQEKSSK
ncbi:hypothetical protein FRC02_003619 [Tulasnella sp. 418]|nr:hypothetical protein FRC02_003619 [Tulasnella sp. 418]